MQISLSDAFKAEKAQQERISKEENERKERISKIIVTTADISEPYEVIGPVYVQISNVGLFTNDFKKLVEKYAQYIKDMADKGILPDVLKRGWHRQFDAAFYIAVEELKVRAEILGADAVIGMKEDLDLDNGHGREASWFYLQMYGTAVKFLETNYNQSAMSVQPILSVSASQNSSNVNVHLNALPASNTSAPETPQAPVKTDEPDEPIVGLDADVLVKRAFLFLEDDNFSEADRYLEQALNQDPENSRAYLGKLMVEKRVHNTDELVKLAQPLDDNKFFKRALRFANDEEKAKLQAYAAASRSA